MDVLPINRFIYVCILKVELDEKEKNCVGTHKHIQFERKMPSKKKEKEILACAHISNRKATIFCLT